MIFSATEKFTRNERIAGQIQKYLASELNEFSKMIGAGLLTVTFVKLSNDRKSAKVYLSLYDNPKKIDFIVQQINDNSYRLQESLSSALRLNKTPILKFFKQEAY